MIVDKTFLQKLKAFGLNSYECKIWTALLSRGVSTAGEMSDISGVPRSRSYDILTTLEKKGLIMKKVGKPIKYLAVPPAEVIERMKRTISHNAEKQIEIIQEAANTGVLNELVKLHTQGVTLVDPSDLTASIKGRNNIHSNILSTMRNAKTSVILATTEGGLKKKSDQLLQTVKDLKKKKVEVTIITQKSKLNENIIDELKKLCNVKFSEERLRLCIVDEKEIIFTLQDDNMVHPTYDVALWINSPYFAKSLVNAYSSIFSSL